jgi:hypothetical protein
MSWSIFIPENELTFGYTRVTYAICMTLAPKGLNRRTTPYVTHVCDVLIVFIPRERIKLWIYVSHVCHMYDTGKGKGG